MALFTCKNVSFSYGSGLAVQEINCSLDSGAYLCVVGCNGSGKTTFIKGLLGLLKPATGQIEFSEDLKRHDIGYLPQQNNIQKNFPASVTEVVLSGRLSRLGASIIYRKADKLAANEAMAQMQIKELARTAYNDLSGGQQQRVLLARAMCAVQAGMKLLIMDEPMNGLDTQVKTELYDLIDELNSQRGITIVMITHDIQTAVAHASHMLVLEGKQEFFGSTHEFQHTQIGRSMLRDSCGNNCAVCGIGLGDM